MRKNILWLNRLFLLFLSEKDEQKRADEQHIRIEQLRHDSNALTVSPRPDAAAMATSICAP